MFWLLHHGFSLLSASQLYMLNIDTKSKKLFYPIWGNNLKQIKYPLHDLNPLILFILYLVDLSRSYTCKESTSNTLQQMSDKSLYYSRVISAACEGKHQNKMHEVAANIFWRCSTVFSHFFRLKPHVPASETMGETLCICLSTQDPTYLLHSSVTGYKRQSIQKCLFISLEICCTVCHSQTLSGPWINISIDF